MPIDPATVTAITSLMSVAGPFIGFSARPLYERWMAKTEAMKVTLLAAAHAGAKKVEAEAEAEADQIKALKRQETEQLLAARTQVPSTEIVPPLALPEPPSLATIHERAEYAAKSRQIVRQYNVEDTFVRSLPHIAEKGISSNPSPEWLIAWSDGAGAQDRDEARELWAKVLAGELAKPGSVSTSTLDTLQKLSRRDAELFAKAAGLANRFGAILFHGTVSEFPHFSLDEFMRLASARLVLPETKLAAMPVATVGGEPAFGFRDFSVVVGVGVRSVPAYWLTTAGLELLAIVDAQPSPEYLRYLATKLPVRRFHYIVREESEVVHYGPGLSINEFLAQKYPSR